MGLASERTLRSAADFVILSRPGQGSELQTRLQRWLDRHGLKLNEEKTRLLEVRQAGFNPNSAMENPRIQNQAIGARR